MPKKQKPLQIIESHQSSVPAKPTDAMHPVHKLTPPPKPKINPSPFDHSVCTNADWLK